MLNLKSDLAVRIQQHIERRALTQSAAATLMGIHQSDVSDIVRGELEGYSIDRLLRFLAALGQEVEIVIRAKAAGRRRRPIRVMDEYPTQKLGRGLMPPPVRRPAR